MLTERTGILCTSLDGMVNMRSGRLGVSCSLPLLLACLLSSTSSAEGAESHLVREVLPSGVLATLLLLHHSTHSKDRECLGRDISCVQLYKLVASSPVDSKRLVTCLGRMCLCVIRVFLRAAVLWSQWSLHACPMFMPQAEKRSPPHDRAVSIVVQQQEVAGSKSCLYL